jgi:hypothetical protein
VKDLSASDVYGVKAERSFTAVQDDREYSTFSPDSVLH